MTEQEYIDDIRLELTGGILWLEIDGKTPETKDDNLKAILKRALRETSRYIDERRYITVPYSQCIDTSGCGIRAVYKVLRSDAAGISTSLDGDSSGMSSANRDPIQVMQWQMLAGGGTFYNLSSYIYNYGAWNTALQIRNTLSTDMAFTYDREREKLYVNTSSGTPTGITIEYAPDITDVSDIRSEYWQDVVRRMAIAYTKIIVGRIRTKFTQSNALWTMDGPTMLQEGNDELKALRERLYSNAQMIMPID